MPARLPIRLPLGASPRRLSYDRRLHLALAGLALPTVALGATTSYFVTGSTTISLAAALVLTLVWALAGTLLQETLTRPLQTLSNVVAALREEDFSFRARGARRGDSLGDLAHEINALASTLQYQRSAAGDALSLVEQVIQCMPSPVLAFGPDSSLRLFNPAAERAFGLTRSKALNRYAADLDLDPLLRTLDERLFPSPDAPGFPPPSSARWSVRRSTFRLHGIPHTLFVLADVAAVLREEERLAWQRLIRVLSHEINNSLTPIKSIAGSLRTNAPASPDLDRGLVVIEERAASLQRFLQAYQELTRLPQPSLRPVDILGLVEAVIALETRLPITLAAGPATTLRVDPDQIQQLLINLLRNAVEAALSTPTRPPTVLLTWTVSATALTLTIRDSGPGLANTENLFVPFYTTKPAGSGVGLALAQGIASAHGGLLRIGNNSPGPGCTAEVQLPLRPQTP